MLLFQESPSIENWNVYIFLTSVVNIFIDTMQSQMRKMLIITMLDFYHNPRKCETECEFLLVVGDVV